MPTSQVIAQTDEGRLTLKGNELILEDTTGGDPIAIRARSPNGGVGKVSFDIPDGHGGWTEIGYLFGKRDERPGMGAKIIFEFWQSGSNDADARRLFEIRHDQILAHVPIQGMATPSARVTRFYTDGGRFLVNFQDDQDNVRAVTYRVDPTKPESEWEVIGVKVFAP